MRGVDGEVEPTLQLLVGAGVAERAASGEGASKSAISKRVTGMRGLLESVGAGGRGYFPLMAWCRSAWSAITSAAIASTMGTARGRTHGS